MLYSVIYYIMLYIEGYPLHLLYAPLSGPFWNVQGSRLYPRRSNFKSKIEACLKHTSQANTYNANMYFVLCGFIYMRLVITCQLFHGSVERLFQRRAEQIWANGLVLHLLRKSNRPNSGDRADWLAGWLTD